MMKWRVTSYEVCMMYKVYYPRLEDTADLSFSMGPKFLSVVERAKTSSPLVLLNAFSLL